MSFGKISNLKFEIQNPKTANEPQNTRNTRKKNLLRRVLSNLTDGIFKTSFCLFFPRIPRVLRLTQLRFPS